MARCKKCGKEIIWIKTPSGRSMPCDPEEVVYWKDSKGKDRVVKPNGEVVACRLDGDPQEATGLGYVSHFATCPNAEEFRSRG